jgi:feruloyl esterase
MKSNGLASMRAALGAGVICLALLVEAAAAAPKERTCADLAGLEIPQVAVTSARDVPAGPFTPPGETRPLTVPAFCRVEAIAHPTSDSSIAIEVWIPPAGAWNGKLLGTGNGGFAGAIGYSALAAALARGYAAAGTDTGHTGDQLEFGLGHPEKVVDWAYRSIHVMTEVAKLAVHDLRGRAPERAYFQGCSTGGQQALSEAQRFPRDYDGIIAGAPAHNRLRLTLGFLWSWKALHADDGSPTLPAAKLPAITRAAIAACDASDGLEDGLLADPRACRFDPSTLRCSGADHESCLTDPQVAAVQKIYDGAKNPRTGEQIFTGWPRGSEQGWGTYLLNPPEPRRLEFFRFTSREPSLDWRTFDWDRDVDFVDAWMPDFSATGRDLRAFKANHGKLIMFTGLADPIVPPQDTIAYYDAVGREMGGLAATQEFFRFFAVPGMGHCMGGPGPNTFDALHALEQWREQGIAPNELPASHTTNGIVDRTRPVCAYPNVARYLGTGSADAAASFACVAPAATDNAPAAGTSRQPLL